MESRKLMSMVDYTKSISGVLNMNHSYVEDKYLQMESCERYAEFLSMPLTLGMFVPTDGFGKFLECPYEYDGNASREWELEYEKALSNVIFEGLKITDKGNFYFIEKNESCLYFRILKNTKTTVESLLKMDWEINISDNAITKYQI